MPDQLYFNGNIYTRVPDAGDEGTDILNRNPEWTNATIVTSLNGQPAIVVGGEFYVKGQNILPGSQGIWERLSRLGRGS